MLSRYCFAASKPMSFVSRFSFATAAGHGISDPKNPRVYFKVSKNGAPIGEIQFEVKYNQNVYNTCSFMQMTSPKQLKISDLCALVTIKISTHTKAALSIA